MWVIRTEQIQVFEGHARQQFQEGMVAHLKEFAPEHAQGVGDSGLRLLIARGHEKAAAYHLTLQGPVRFFLELMVLYGSDFDTDPLLPWAGGYLRTDQHIDELHRADHLHELAQAYHTEAVGPDYEFEIAALKRLLAVSPELWLSEAHRDNAAIIREIYPEKSDRAGPDGVAAVITQAGQGASAHQLTAGAGRRLLAGLMFAFGHGCLTDPQYRWLAENLVETARIPVDQRVNRLATRAAAYCAHALSILERD